MKNPKKIKSLKEWKRKFDLNFQILIPHGTKESLRSILLDVRSAICIIITPDIQKMSMFTLLTTWEMTFYPVFQTQK